MRRAMCTTSAHTRTCGARASSERPRKLVQWPPVHVFCAGPCSCAHAVLGRSMWHLGPSLPCQLHPGGLSKYPACVELHMQVHIVLWYPLVLLRYGLPCL